MTRSIATFGGGCFWCTEAVFKRLKGVLKVVSGYSGGKRQNPSYQQVSTGATGHAESVQITFDPAVIPYDRLLDVFFATHDPTTMNRQGEDSGTQYRSVIFYHDEFQKKTAEKKIAILNKSLSHSREGGRPHEVESTLVVNPEDSSITWIPNQVRDDKYDGNYIVTQLLPFEEFYTAEEYHQNYYDNNPLYPYCKVVINPKIRKLLEKFGKEVKEEYK